MKKLIILLLCINLTSCLFSVGKYLFTPEVYFVDDYKGNTYTFYNSKDAIARAIQLAADKLLHNYFSYCFLDDQAEVLNLMKYASYNMYNLKGQEAQKMINKIQSAVRQCTRNIVGYVQEVKLQLI